MVAKKQNNMKIIIINGPNLNLLGRRERGIYGSKDWAAVMTGLREQFPDHELLDFQSNHEGGIIDCLHEWGFSDCGIILNAGGYTHTSIAIADAISAINSPVVEVHISNIHAREAFRRHSYTASRCVGQITGLGTVGYALAVRYLLENHAKPAG